MAAVRESASLIAFGFTVYKFFEFEVKEKQATAPIVGPREFGITMILIGLTLLVVSSCEYRRDRRAW
jgi:putative membrane protein